MKANFKNLLISILIPVLLGALVGFLTTESNNYNTIIMPSFAPPGFLFPIVWTILYTLMGISSYIVSESLSINKDDALKIYFLQLIVNLLWSFIFFTFKLYLLAFIWIILLIVLVVLMIIRFYKISRVSAYLQIPYLLWLIFASVLNFSIYLLN